MSGNFSKGILKYNLKSRRVETSSGPSSYSPYIKIGDWGAGYKLLVNTGSLGLFSSVDTGDFSDIEQFQLGHTIDNMTFNKSGFVVASILDHLSVENNLLVYKKSNNEITEVLNNMTGGTSLVKMADEESNLFYEASASHLYLRNVNNEGKINTLKETQISLPTNVNFLKKSIAISPDGNLFIPYKRTIVFNKDLETVKDLEIESDAHLFSSDGNFLFVGNLGEVLTYETDNYTLVNNPIKLPFDDFEVRYLFEINNELIIVSTHYSYAFGPDALISRFTL